MRIQPRDPTSDANAYTRGSSQGVLNHSHGEVNAVLELLLSPGAFSPSNVTNILGELR